MPREGTSGTFLWAVVTPLAPAYAHLKNLFKPEALVGCCWSSPRRKECRAAMQMKGNPSTPSTSQMGPQPGFVLFGTPSSYRHSACGLKFLCKCNVITFACENCFSNWKSYNYMSNICNWQSSVAGLTNHCRPSRGMKRRVKTHRFPVMGMILSTQWSLLFNQSPAQLQVINVKKVSTASRVLRAYFSSFVRVCGLVWLRK